MSDATEWPTSDRIADLREQGIVSYSKRSAACLTITALALTALALPNAFDVLKKLFETSLSDSREVLREVLLTWIMLPVVLVSALLIVWGLFQTRFLFRLSLVTFDFGRLWPQPNASVPSFMMRMAAMVAAVTVASIGSYVLLTIIGGQIFRILHDPSINALRQALLSPIQLLPIVLLVSFVCALVFLLYQKLIFGLRHRMTRKEVLAEQQG